MFSTGSIADLSTFFSLRLPGRTCHTPYGQWGLVGRFSLPLPCRSAFGRFFRKISDFYLHWHLSQGKIPEDCRTIQLRSEFWGGSYSSSWHRCLLLVETILYSLEYWRILQFRTVAPYRFCAVGGLCTSQFPNGPSTQPMGSTCGIYFDTKRLGYTGSEKLYLPLEILLWETFWWIIVHLLLALYVGPKHQTEHARVGHPDGRTWRFSYFENRTVRCRLETHALVVYRGALALFECKKVCMNHNLYRTSTKYAVRGL